MTPTNFIFLAAALLAGMSAGAVLLRTRSSISGKLFAVGMLLLAAESTLNFISFKQPLIAEVVHWQQLRFVPVSLLPVIWVAFSLAYSRGNSHGFLVRWRTVLTALALTPIVLLILGRGGMLSLEVEAVGGVHWNIHLNWPAQGLQFVLIAAAVLVLMNLEQTFRVSVGTQRWRLKLVVVGICTIFVVRIYTVSQVLLYRSVMEPMALLNSVALIIGCLLVATSVLRTGEFSIDLYPSESALRRSVVVMAVGVYLVSVGLLARLAGWVGGAVGVRLQALLVLVALVGLALLLMSDKLRSRTRAWIDRNFNRPHYNYRTIWKNFAAATAGHGSEPEACAALAKWISQTLNALSVSVWLLEEADNDLRLAGTTLDPEQRTVGDVRNDRGRWVVIVQSIKHLTKLVNLDRAGDAPVSELIHLHPRVFPIGGDRWAIPLGAPGSRLGVLLVGDRVNGVPFTSEDEELLTTVAEQAAGLLQNIRLSRRLVEAREMEAFQSMSTFFVHDLKNTASSLSLMLQNLPRHFDNPAFREDALRSIRKSVERINHLIESLSALRRELVVNPQPGDLATLRQTAEQLAADRSIPLRMDCQPAGPANFDDDQLKRVLTNLIVNAHEASPPGQPITFTTGSDESTAWFAVRDEGCGMGEEFIQRQLFRPFQTTKQAGTGIGLYHSKLIIDAHGGRMEVSSQPGAGSEFRVRLPLTRSAHETSRTDH